MNQQSIIMKQFKYFITILLLLLSISSCKYFGTEVIESFEAIDKEVVAQNKSYTDDIAALQQQLTDSAMTNPEKFAGAFNHMNEFHTKSERLLTELQHVRELIEEQVGETGNYENLDKNIDVVFFTGNQHTDNGAQFVQAIKDFNLTASDQLFFFPKAEKMAQQAFSVDQAKDRDGNKVDWLTYNYKGFPAIASMTKISILENDVKNIETTFLKALIEKPQF